MAGDAQLAGVGIADPFASAAAALKRWWEPMSVVVLVGLGALVGLVVLFALVFLLLTDGDDERRNRRE